MPLFEWLRDQLFLTLPYPQETATGQTIIVTGANVGLGFEAAKFFVRLGAKKVIIAVRDQEKGEAAKKLIEESEHRRDVVEVWKLDLCSYTSVKQFAEKVQKSLPRVDVLLANAGIAKYTYSVAEDNETTITTNVVSTFLLALLLLPKLQETAKSFGVTPRLTIVSSNVHAFTQFPEKSSPDIFQTLNDKNAANMMDRYNVSKLIQVFYARELAARTKTGGKTKVTINLVNPGLCVSNLAREAGWPIYLFRLAFARTTENGSRNLVYAAQAGQETHGEYISNCHVELTAPLVRSSVGAETQTKVWDQLSKKLETIQPGIMAVVPKI
ncbi:hypothetical protein MMC15_003941 [Xylographa vitiligo]|nr:hypothetical protein [Xylographa vitiligo]